MVGITSGSALSDYRSRAVVIDVAGMANQTISRVSNYQVKVPFSQMSAAMRTISAQGGKVVHVAVQGGPPQAPQTPQETPDSKPAKATTKKTGTKKAANNKKKNIVSRLTNRKGRRSKKTS